MPLAIKESLLHKFVFVSSHKR